MEQCSVPFRVTVKAASVRDAEAEAEMGVAAAHRSAKRRRWEGANARGQAGRASGSGHHDPLFDRDARRKGRR